MLALLEQLCQHLSSCLSFHFTYSVLLPDVCLSQMLMLCLHLFCFLQTSFLCVALALLDQAGLRFPGARVSGVCEPPDVGAGNPTWFFCNYNVCPQTLSLLFSPLRFALFCRQGLCTLAVLQLAL